MDTCIEKAYEGMPGEPAAIAATQSGATQPIPACFEGLGALHLLMPCHRVADEEAGDGTRIPWNTWMSEWVEASRWMPTNRFWLAAWFGIFSRLAKHDARRVVEWSAHAAYLHTVALWFMEVPVGGGEGACPFGRRTPGRAAYLFGRSVNDGERRATYAAKYLAHRVADESASELGDGGRSAPADFEALVDVLENYAHPSNAGRWTQTIALFLSAAVKSFRERCADETRDPPPRPAIRRFARSAARLMASARANQAEVERVADALNRVDLELAKLAKRVQGNEEWVGSINAFRRQINASLTDLQASVRALQAAP